jgi:hypothetical protein
MSDDSIFNLAEAMAVQKGLREAAGSEEEIIYLSDVIGMSSDSIDKLREQGRSDGDIAALIQSISGKPVTAEDVEHYYLSPEERDLLADEAFDDL